MAWPALPLPPRRWRKVGLTKAKSGAKSGLRVARPKVSAGGENPTLCRAAKGGATGKQRGGQRGESTSGLEAGERVVISGPAGPSSAAAPLKVVEARGESAGAVLDRDAAFMMGTSSKRRAQYPRVEMGYGTARNYSRGRAAGRTGLRTTHRSIRLKLPTAAWSVGIVTENGKTYQETLRQDGAEFVFFLRGGLFRVTLPQGGP